MLQVMLEKLWNLYLICFKKFWCFRDFGSFIYTKTANLGSRCTLTHHNEHPYIRTKETVVLRVANGQHLEGRGCFETLFFRAQPSLNRLTDFNQCRTNSCRLVCSSPSHQGYTKGIFLNVIYKPSEQIFLSRASRRLISEMLSQIKQVVRIFVSVIFWKLGLGAFVAQYGRKGPSRHVMSLAPKYVFSKVFSSFR